MVFSKTSWKKKKKKKADSYLFLVLEVIAPMVCLTPIEVKFRPLSVKGSVSKLIGFVRGSSAHWLGSVLLYSTEE